MRAGLDVSYQKHHDVYCRIFDRCGLKYVVVDADSGAMGGSQSQEFMVYTDAGEDLVVSCPECGYAANLEKATSKLDAGRRPGADGRRQAGAGAHAGAEDDRRRGASSWGSRRRTRSRRWPTWRWKKPAKTGKSADRPVVVFDARRPHVERGEAVGGGRRAENFRPMHAGRDSGSVWLAGGIPGTAEYRVGEAAQFDTGESLLSWTRRLRGRKNLIAAPTKRTITCATSRRT